MKCLKNVGNYLSEIDMDEKHLNRFIIGAVNVEDAPLKNNRINFYCFKTSLQWSYTGKIGFKT